MDLDGIETAGFNRQSGASKVHLKREGFRRMATRARKREDEEGRRNAGREGGRKGGEQERKRERKGPYNVQSPP